MKQVVFIGTSPINLFKGYLLAKAAPETQFTFIDQYDRLGGAWYSDKSELGHEIECGCHIWSYNPEVYKYFKETLGLNMEKMKPSPVFKYRNMNVSYPLFTIQDSYKYIFKNSITLRAKKLKAIKDSPQYYWKLFNKKNQYPKEGSPALITKLKALIDDLQNVNFLLGKHIDEINFADQIKLKGSGFEMVCDQIFATSVSSVKTLSKDKKLLKLQQNQINYIHLLVQSDKKPKKKATYHRLINDKAIHRITDVSYQSSNEEFLFLVGIHQEAYDSMEPSALVDHFRKYLLGQKIIDDGYQTKFVKEHFFPTYYISEEQREEVKNFDERIELSYSTDIMYGFYYILKEQNLI